MKLYASMVLFSLSFGRNGCFSAGCTKSSCVHLICSTGPPSSCSVLRRMCSHHSTPPPLSFLYAYIYTHFFIRGKKILFQFYRVVFPCFELIIWGKGVFCCFLLHWRRSSCKISLGLSLLKTKFVFNRCCLEVANFCFFSVLVFFLSQGKTAESSFSIYFGDLVKDPSWVSLSF